MIRVRVGLNSFPAAFGGRQAWTILGARNMIPKISAKKNWVTVNSLIMLALTLTFCTRAWPAFAQQNQPGEAQANVAPPADSQTQGQPDTPPLPQQPDL